MDNQLPHQPLNHPSRNASSIADAGGPANSSAVSANKPAPAFSANKPADQAHQSPTPASTIQITQHPFTNNTITSPSQPISNPYITQQKVKSFSLKGFLKLIYILVFVSGVLVAAVFLGKKMLIRTTAGDGEILLQARYQPVLWKDFGVVFEPILAIEVYYPGEGWQKIKFLLDSGALVSSLPREEAKKMGLSLSQLPRSTFGGFGGTTSFAYKSEAKIKLGEQETIIPIVFTETEGTKAILGRSGFFERYNVYFNANTERIEIRD